MGRCSRLHNRKQLTTCTFTGNHIGAKGASALAESLKKKKSLSKLYLSGMLELYEQLHDEIQVTTYECLLICRKRHRRRGSSHPSRIFKTEHNPDEAVP